MELLDKGILEGLQLNILNNYDVLKEHEEKIGKGFDLDKTLSIKHVADFDKYYLSPINGFRNCQEFYDHYSSYKKIKHIKIPTLFIHSKDDPVCIKE